MRNKAIDERLVLLLAEDGRFTLAGLVPETALAPITVAALERRVVARRRAPVFPPAAQLNLFVYPSRRHYTTRAQHGRPRPNAAANNRTLSQKLTIL